MRTLLRGFTEVFNLSVGYIFGRRAINLDETQTRRPSVGESTMAKKSVQLLRRINIYFHRSRRISPTKISVPHRRYLIKVILPIIQMFVCVFLYSNPVIADISLPWSSTYNCAEWSQGQALSCDGLNTAGDWTSSNGSKEQITTAANYPGGDGGKGQRHWLGAGTHNNSGGLNIVFNQPYPSEVWLRVYFRFQNGFTLDASTTYYFKILYFNVAPPNAYYEFPYDSNRTRLYASTAIEEYLCTNCGWQSLFGGLTSDGSWHSLELYFKSETSSGATDGIFRSWIDGVLKVNTTNAHLALYGNGVGGVLIGGNIKNVPTGPDIYVDYDDWSIVTTTPSNRDASGNPMIGPILAKFTLRAPLDLIIQ